MANDQMASRPKGTSLGSYRSASLSSFESNLMQKSSFIQNINKRCDDLDNAKDSHGETQQPPITTWSHRVQKLTLNWWLWEVVCLLFSAASLCAIVLLLMYYNRQRLPAQWPAGITLNAAIAIFSACFKFALAVPIEAALGQLKWNRFHGAPRPLIEFEKLDEASRGPLGAVSLLWHTKARRLSSIGAAVMILSLGLDPFFQQLILLPVRPTALEQTTLTRCKDLEVPYAVSYLNGSKISAADALFIPVVQNYMVFNATSSVAPAVCSTKGCNWPPFQTLAVCSTCTDISEHLTFTCRKERGDWKNTDAPGQSSLRKVTPFNEPNNTETTESCGYFLNSTSSNPTLMNGYAIERNGSTITRKEVLISRILNLQDHQHGLFPWDGSLKFKNFPLPIADFIHVSSPNAAAVSSNNTPTTAVECTLRWCVKTLSVQSKDGVYQEHELSTAYSTNQTTLPWKYTLRPSGAYSIGYKHNLTIFSKGETFSISNMTLWKTITAFSPLSPHYIIADNTTAQMQQINYDYATNIYSSPFLVPNRTTSYVNEFANALAWVVRSYPNSTERVSGSLGEETFISVAWAWMALPILLWSLSSVFLGMVIIQSMWKQVDLYKNSALATLLCGFTDDSRKVYRLSNDMLYARSKASGALVRLDPTQRSFELLNRQMR